MGLITPIVKLATLNGSTRDWYTDFSSQARVPPRDGKPVYDSFVAWFRPRLLTIFELCEA